MRTSLTLRRLLDLTLVLMLALTAWRVVSGTNDARRDETIPNVTPAMKTGNVFTLPASSWSAPRTVVLVVSSTCPACNENLPFYREVGALATSQLHVVAVSREPENVVAEWLARHQVTVKSIHTVENLLAYGITLTPMVLMVDAEGRVTDLMIKKLDATSQAQVLHRLRNSDTAALDNSQKIRELSVEDLQRLMSSGRVQLLDVRPRERFQQGHRAEARNIPMRELAARAPIELDSRLPVIVDCLQPGAGACRGAAWSLVDAGFGAVSILRQ